MPRLTSPVLVVHGVNTRDRDAFESRVKSLEGRIDCGRRFIPCFWGDLGIDDTYLPDVLPSTAETLAESQEWIANNERPSRLGTGLRAIGGGVLMAMFGDEADAKEHLYTEYLPRTQYQRHEQLVNEMQGVEFLHDLRAAATAYIARFAGDVALYQGRHAREAIHARVRETIAEHAPGYGTAERPLTVLAHSLGGVIALDMALGDPSPSLWDTGSAGPPAPPRLFPDPSVGDADPLWVDQLITFGSQPGLFHLIDGRYPHVPRYTSGNPVRLPRTVGRWTNVWGSIDPFAFLAGKIFVLHNGKPPRDFATVCPSPQEFHTYYWTDETTITLFGEILFGLHE